MFVVPRDLWALMCRAFGVAAIFGIAINDELIKESHASERKTSSFKQQPIPIFHFEKAAEKA